MPDLYASPASTLEPGETYTALWGSGYESARAFVEVSQRGKLLQSYWTKPDRTQQSIQQRVNESMRGGFTVRTTMVRENRAYIRSNRVSVPWSNKHLTLEWEHMVSRLKPASQETWTAIIRGPDAERAAAEMVATLYDASLDAYLQHDWPSSFNAFRTNHSSVQAWFENRPKDLQRIYHSWRITRHDGGLTYRHFPSRIIQHSYGYEFMRRGKGVQRGQAVPMEGLAVPAAMENAMSMGNADLAAVDFYATDFDTTRQDSPADKPSTADLEHVSARKNLNETAFFFPHLIADDGVVRLQFTMPEALTQWKFLGFAHDRELRGGLLAGTTVTAKDLMVQPNPPRFLREGDIVEFTVKISNQSPTRPIGNRATIVQRRANEHLRRPSDRQHRSRQGIRCPSW